MWPITLCLFRVSDHLFVVGVIKRTFEALFLPNNTSFYNIIMSSSTPRSAAPLRRSARGGARGFKASSGKQARTQSSGLRARGATADGDGAATLSDEEQSDDGDSTGAADATQPEDMVRALAGSGEPLGGETQEARRISWLTCRTTHDENCVPPAGGP